MTHPQESIIEKEAHEENLRFIEGLRWRRIAFAVLVISGALLLVIFLVWRFA